MRQVEDLLDYYLQRAASTQTEAERLLAGARDLEESIGVSLSARRFEVQPADVAAAEHSLQLAEPLGSLAQLLLSACSRGQHSSRLPLPSVAANNVALPPAQSGQSCTCLTAA